MIQRGRAAEHAVRRHTSETLVRHVRGSVAPDVHALVVEDACADVRVVC